MRRTQLWQALLIVATASHVCAADPDAEAIEIPLTSIWALNMPGTLDIRDLDPRREREPQSIDEFIRTSLVEHMSVSLGPRHWPKKGHGAGRGFIVVGTGLDALRAAHAVLVEKEERDVYLPANKQLTLVFYAYASGRYVHLSEAARKGSTITVKFHFAAHRTQNYSTHFALIPLGYLPIGKVRVRYVEVPGAAADADFPPYDSGTLHRIVCDSFSCEIESAAE